MSNCVLIKITDLLLDEVQGFDDIDDAFDASEKMARELGFPEDELEKMLESNRSDLYYDGVSIYVRSL